MAYDTIYTSCEFFSRAWQVGKVEIYVYGVCRFSEIAQQLDIKLPEIESTEIRSIELRSRSFQAHLVL